MSFRNNFVFRQIRRPRRYLQRVWTRETWRRTIEKQNLRQFKRAGVEPVQLTVRHSLEPRTGTDVVLRREKQGIVALVNMSWGWSKAVETRDKIACCAYWFSHVSPEIEEILINASDGEFPSFSHYRYSSNRPDKTLLPDPHFFRDQGYRATDEIAQANTLRWEERSDNIVWRGSLNGIGKFLLGKENLQYPGVIQRLRMAEACREQGVDFRFVEEPEKDTMPLLSEARLIGGRIPLDDWANMKFAVDIDGFTNAWSNFLQRLKLGCCVLKVESPFGFRQWYYDAMQPWEHFVPIRADLSDLAERIEWVRGNSAKAKEIAAAGQAFARELTFDSQNKYAIEAITARETRS